MHNREGAAIDAEGLGVAVLSGGFLLKNTVNLELEETLLEALFLLVIVTGFQTHTGFR